MEEGIANVNPESILIIDKEGALKRKRCPFKALLIISVANLCLDEIYSVQAVLIDSDNVMVYYVKGLPYHYYYFAILD
jgi:hypothetical protein